MVKQGNNVKGNRTALEKGVKTRQDVAVDIAAMQRRLEAQALKAAKAGDLDMGNETVSALAKAFSTGETCGRAVYSSFTDEELLDILRLRTKELGHVPSQKEIFWVYRNYLRMRFEKWPYALKKAGLSTKAGKGGMTVSKMEQRNQRYAELMEMVRSKARELGRPPHMFELGSIQQELKGWFLTWAQVLDAAGIDRGWQQKEILYKARNLSAEEKDMLGEIQALACKLGRSPLRCEVTEEMRRRLNSRCGTWRNILYQIDLEPVAKISPFGNTYLDRGKEQRKKHRDVLENSLYKLVSPDAEIVRMLAEVKRIAEQLGRAPVKSEIPPRTYSCLTKKCSTYRNVLHQIELEPLDKSTAFQIQARVRSGKNGKGC